MATVLELDHVNIITGDLEGTARWYVDLLGLERRDAPPPLTPAQAQWLYDARGRAVLHINSTDCPRAYDRPVPPGATGAIHHVALACAGHDALQRRLRERGFSYECNVVAAIGLRQIFTLDPNGVLLELNFFGD